MAGSDSAAGVEPGSFRDRDSRVVLTDDGVYRLLSRRGAEDWKALEESGLLERLQEAGDLVPTERIPTDSLPRETRAALHGGTEAVLRHERIPFVSYPYEWTFGMLRDAALLQLDLQLAALAEGMTLKDATPYNVQFRGAEPTFIDIGSFEVLPEGSPWVGYRQFCMLNLYPLLLQAYKDVPFHPWLRGSIDGIAPTDAAKLFGFRDRFRKGVFMHVAMHGRMERRNQAREGGDVRRDLKEAKFKPEMIEANVRGLRKLVAGLTWKAGETAWTGYRADNTYSDDDAARKQEFVRAVAAETRPPLVWDMGCNDGAYSRIAAESAEQVIAFDYDHATVDAFYRSLRTARLAGADADAGTPSADAARDARILPLVANLADPSPGLGWRGLERRTLEDRGSPDLVLALALIHHVSITANVPIAEFLDWLRGLECAAVIEFPKREDPMVQRLLSGKGEGANADYDHENFEARLRERFQVAGSKQLPSNTRLLYHVHP